VFPEPVFIPEVDLILVCMPVLDGKPDVLLKPPLEPPVQGRRHQTAQVGDAFTFSLKTASFLG